MNRPESKPWLCHLVPEGRLFNLSEPEFSIHKEGVCSKSVAWESHRENLESVHWASHQYQGTELERGLENEGFLFHFFVSNLDKNEGDLAIDRNGTLAPSS